MDDAGLQRRLDAALLLLLGTFLLLLVIGVAIVPEESVGALVLTALIGYGHVKSSRTS